MLTEYLINASSSQPIGLKTLPSASEKLALSYVAYCHFLTQMGQTPPTVSELIADLMEDTGKNEQTLRTRLTRLMDAKLVHEAADLGDGRKRSVRLTEKGEQQFVAYLEEQLGRLIALAECVEMRTIEKPEHVKVARAELSALGAVLNGKLVAAHRKAMGLREVGQDGNESEGADAVDEALSGEAADQVDDDDDDDDQHEPEQDDDPEDGISEI